MANQSKSEKNLFDRSDKNSSPISRFIFCFFRAVDPYLQQLLIFNGYGYQILSKAGIATVPSGPKGTALVAMAAACALKQIINMTCIFEAKIPVSAVVIICICNTVLNSLAGLSSLIYPPSNELGTLQYVGISMFTVGLLTELISELQRKSFKDNPANKGKLYTDGLFSLARHINYGGYTLWRTGIALTSGNYWLAALQFTWHMIDFTKRGVPELGDYCSKKYGEEWKKYERDVPNILIPYIW
jgi:protein-S-isoprenylcysteine O-methyltransferase Ste14